MRPVDALTVEATWKEMCCASQRDAERWVEEMTAEQPVVLAYLLAVDHDFLNQDERELLLYLGVAVWRMMCRAGCRPATVTEELLERLERRKEKELKRLVGKGPEVLDRAARDLLIRWRQPELLRYVVEALTEEDEPGCAIRPEAKGLMAFRLMTVIEALDSSTLGQAIGD
ncbi:MAG: hypothetical protein AB1446_01645 [Bacillota bacterium]